MKLRTSGIQVIPSLLESSRSLNAAHVQSDVLACLVRVVHPGFCTAAIVLSRIRLRRFNILIATDESFVVLSIDHDPDVWVQSLRQQVWFQASEI